MKANDTNQATPSQRPWKISDHYGWQIDSAETGYKIAECANLSLKSNVNDANAALIVQAVNLFALHEAVASAVEKLLPAISHQDRMRTTSTRKNIEEAENKVDEISAELCSALSALKAKKGQEPVETLHP